MKKNIVFLTSIKNSQHSDKYGGYEWMEISKKSWKYWCDKNECELFIYDNPNESDLFRYRVTWQRWFDVFDELEKNNIDYDKIFVVDSTSIVRWDCPNFFDMIDDRMVAWRDMSNLNWIYYSVEGYKPYFDNFELDLSKYINCGSIIINETHKDFLRDVKKFYYNNKIGLIKLQDEIVKKGTDQTPFNYLLQKNNVDVNMDLPKTYNLNHMDRYDWFHHNWQLNEDTTPFFIKYSYIWRFTGIPKDKRTELMEQTWNLIKLNYTFDEDEILLNSVKHKDAFKNATSRQFKKDLIEFFSDDKYKDMSVVELGACHGDTTKIFSSLFKNVYACDWSEDNVKLIAEKCKDCNNVNYEVMDVTNDEWKFPKADVVFVDASHDYPQVSYDIEKVINYFDDPIIVMDDYGNPNNKNVRISIDEKIQEGKLKIYKNIGEYPGFKTKAGWSMVDREGVILKK